LRAAADGGPMVLRQVAPAALGGETAT